MSRRISISARSGGFLLSVAMEVMELHPQDYADHHRRAAEELRAALASLDRKRPSKVSHKSRKPTKAEKRDARAAIREKVFARAAETNDDPTDHYQRCEGPPSHDPTNAGRCGLEATELAHVFGRGKGRLPESERTCLALCRWCHRYETKNEPSGAAWWEFFATFLERNGWTFEASKARERAHFEATRSKLGAGLKERQK